MRRQSIIALLAVLAAVPCAALNTAIPGTGLPSAADYASGLLPERTGVVSWKTLSQVEPLQKDGKVIPGFSLEILGLDRTDVKVQGFMIPLDMGDKQKRFLISAVPPHCQFCLPAGPDEIVEVEARSPVNYTFDPIVVGGKFSVLKDDASGILYRMTGAVRVDESPPGLTLPR
jgi:uncharacterized protein